MEAEKYLDERFSLSRLNDILLRCRGESGQIYLRLYIEAFEELNKFFPLLGSIFGFVVSDVKDKISILQHYISKDDETSKHYETVQSMIEYEVSNDITVKKGYPPSASRTLLRLHRSLAFIIQFLQNVKDASGSQKLSSVAGKAYDSTLAKHHVWIIRKAVSLALIMLPTRDHLIEKMGDGSIEDNLQLLIQAISHAQPIYDTVQELYSKHDILALP